MSDGNWRVFVYSGEIGNSALHQSALCDKKMAMDLLRTVISASHAIKVKGFRLFVKTKITRQEAMDKLKLY